MRHTSPIPQLMALNNMSNSLDSRVKAVVGEEWSEFVLMIREYSWQQTFAKFHSARGRPLHKG